MQHAPARELLHFIKNSPTCYHVTENIRQKLLANGYTELSERERLLSAAVESAKELGVRMDVGNLYSSDTFYDASNPSLKWADMGVLAIEMEAAALYCNAAYTKKRGLSLCSISDNILTGEELSPEARQTSFTAMMKIALETAVKMAAESQK